MIKIDLNDMEYEYIVYCTEKNINTQNYDEWGAAFLYLDDKFAGDGIEYHLAYNNGECHSAFYPFREGKTDTSVSVPYEIDFTNKNWPYELVKAMKVAISDLF